MRDYQYPLGTELELMNAGKVSACSRHAEPLSRLYFQDVGGGVGADAVLLAETAARLKVADVAQECQRALDLLDEIDRCQDCQLVKALMANEQFASWLLAEDQDATEKDRAAIHRVLDPATSPWIPFERPSAEVLDLTVVSSWPAEPEELLRHPKARVDHGEALKRLELLGRAGAVSTGPIEVEPAGAPEFLACSLPGEENLLNPSHLVSWLRLGRGVHDLDSIGADEALVLPLSGQLRWIWEGGEPVELHGIAQSAMPMWLSADPGAEILGLPPSRVEVTSETALLLVVLARTSGVEHNAEPGELGPIHLGKNHWDEESTETFWELVPARVPQLRLRQRPFVEEIPVGERALEVVPTRYRNRDKLNLSHQTDIRQYQLRNRSLMHWLVGDEQDFQVDSAATDLATGNSQVRSQPSIDLSLIELPTRGARVPRQRINLSKHPGQREILVPLVGAARVLVAPAKLSESDARQQRLGPIEAEGRGVFSALLRAASGNNSSLPSQLQLDSDSFHTLVATAGGPAILLHVRCRGYSGSPLNTQVENSGLRRARGEHRRRA